MVGEDYKEGNTKPRLTHILKNPAYIIRAHFAIGDLKQASISLNAAVELGNGNNGFAFFYRAVTRLMQAALLGDDPLHATSMANSADGDLVSAIEQLESLSVWLQWGANQLLLTTSGSGGGQTAGSNYDDFFKQTEFKLRVLAELQRRCRRIRKVREERERERKVYLMRV